MAHAGISPCLGKPRPFDRPSCNALSVTRASGLISKQWLLPSKQKSVEPLPTLLNLQVMRESRDTLMRGNNFRCASTGFLTPETNESDDGDDDDDDDVLLELRNVHKAFGSKKILQGCSFKIRRGEAVGVIGASGTGKSTTLRLLAGLLAPDAGEVLVMGQPRRGLLSDTQDAKHPLKIGMVFQSAALFDSLTVGENVGFLLYEHTDLPKDRIQQIVKESLAEVGLKDVEHLYPSQLSGGMQKRVALARAVVRDDSERQMEQVLMYDEPTAGLDPVASTVVEDLIRSLHSHSKSEEKGGISSYIVVTHQHSTITRAVDRIIFLHKGRVVWEGSSEEFETTEEAIVRQFATGSLEGPIVYR